jgi:putative peptidoglycan lipid II flippase
MKGVFSLFFGNLASKVTGGVREILFASLFGATNIAAAFRISQTSFYAPTHAFVVETVGASFVPAYKESERGGGDMHAQALLIVAAASALLASGIIGAILFFFAPEIVSAVAPGANSDAKSLAQLMLTVCALVTPFYVVGNFLGYLEVAHGRYAPIASRPVLLNILAIIGALAAALFHAPLYLVIGVLVGHVAFFIWTLVSATRAGFLRWWIPRGGGIYRIATRRFMRTAGPLIVLPLLAQGNAVAERVVGSFLGTAVIPCVDYARFITDTTLALFAVPLGVATMATYGGLRTSEMHEHVNKVASNLALVAFPLSAFLACNARDVVQVLFERGAFDVIAANNTTEIVRGLGIGLGATTVSYYFQMALNAQLRNIESVFMVCLAVGVNIAINLLLWRRLGPFALGLGATAYGVTQYITGLLRLKLVGRQGKLVLYLIAGCGSYVTFYLLLPHFDFVLLRLSVQVGGAIAVWAVLIYFSPPLRAIAQPALRSMLGMLGRAVGHA